MLRAAVSRVSAPVLAVGAAAVGVRGFVVKATVKEATDTSGKTFNAPDPIQEAFLEQFRGFRSRLETAKASTTKLSQAALDEAAHEMNQIKRRDSLDFIDVALPKETKLDKNF